VIGWVVRIAIAVLFAVSVYVLGASMLRKFTVPGMPEPSPEDLRPVELHFRCVVCGAEVTMTAASADEPDAPRHCREDMVPVER
jgi:hypothetical protein